MTDDIAFLKSLISTAGLSGHEEPVLELIEQQWKPLVDQLSRSRVRSLHALKRGRGKGRRPTVMIATHMDAVGMIVTKVMGGFLKIHQIGGIDPRILPGTPVIVHAKRDLPGVVVLPPAFTLPESVHDLATDLHHLLVDVGLTAARAAQLVRVGDVVSFDTQPVELAGGTLTGHSLDNRASVAALTICLEELQHKSHAWDVWAVATSQEEETFAGATTSAYSLNPDLAVVIDVTHAKGPGADGWETFALGKGPTLGWGPNLHPFLYRHFEELAKKLEIPVSMETSTSHSGTDAFAVQIAREGIPTMLLGIPLRYMHTAVELIAVKDMQRTGRLLAEFIAGLQPDFMSMITWEEEDAS